VSLRALYRGCGIWVLENFVTYLWDFSGNKNTLLFQEIFFPEKGFTEHSGGREKKTGFRIIVRRIV